MTKRPGYRPVRAGAPLSEGPASGASDRRGRRIVVASSEQDKRLRAELAQGLGYFPASVTAEDVARYRHQIAARKARGEAGERDGWGGRCSQAYWAACRSSPPFLGTSRSRTWTRSSTPRTTPCVEAAVSTARSIAVVARRSCATASRDSPTGSPRATPDGRPQSTYRPSGLSTRSARTTTPGSATARC